MCIRDSFTIQQYRYGGDLEIEVSRIESETLCRDCMIPRFTLQPVSYTHLLPVWSIPPMT